MKRGMVYFVGAGPGAPGLITLRGVQCLELADAVLYDYLANRQILSHVRSTSELICLGRHRRSDVWPQGAINQELVRRALNGQTVVRLKGGDPMIFGRAAEELGAVSAAGVDFEIVPGVTAASGIAAYAGITLTDREHSSAVAVITGHQQSGKPDSALDYRSLATFPGTLVVYMGVSTVSNWSQRLLEAGKPAETPVLIVRRGTWPDQRTVECNLGEVAARLTPYRQIPPPALVIVGEAARRHVAFDWFSRLPLLGQRIVVTRPEHQADQLVHELGLLGADVIVQPAIRITPPASWDQVDACLDRVEQFQSVVFSSANGVTFFLDRLLSRGQDMRRLGNSQLAVIGPATAKALASYHLRPDVQPQTYRAEALAEILTQEAAGKRFLLVRASRGREVLAEQLVQAGGIVEQVVAYQSHDVQRLSDEVNEFFQEGPVDWITATSSAIARSVRELFAPHLPNFRVASISPITSQTLRECGIEPTVEANEYTAAGVLEAIVTTTLNRG